MKAVRAAIALLVAAVFLGYMMLWCMKPTNTFYLHWLPDVHAETSSTYFGEQGGNILIFTFPILFIAVMSCVYLHLGKKNQVDDDTSWFRRRFGSWKRTALVKGPLGIVSWIELSFLAMFVALLGWSLWSYLHNMFSYAATEAAQEGLQVWQVKLNSAGLALGLVGNACLAFIFFPVSRGSSILQFLGLTSEASIKYHIWLGHITMTIFTGHGFCYIVFWAQTHQISQMLKWDKYLISNVAGEIALASGLIMWAMSLARVRRKIFELFLYTHQLYVVFFVFYVFHVGFSGSCFVLPGFYLFLIDRYLRYLQSQQKVCLVSARILPCETVELNFSKSPGLSYTPLSSMFINLPSISKLQWHPFTVTSSSNMDPELLSIIIKCDGAWSRRLYQMLSDPSPANRLQASVEGPYGPSTTTLMRYDRLVLISGGSGITPFVSIIRELIFIANKTDGRTPKVLLVCAFTKSTQLTTLELLLPVSGSCYDTSRLQLQIEVYITREKELQTDNQKHVRTILFQPDVSDVPVSTVLGPNSWLWLAAVIASSFVIFLVLVAILTRLYIYPIDHNTDTKYSVPAKSAFFMSFLCVSISTAASAAFLWNKKQNAKELKKIINMDTPGPKASSETELESLPRQALLQAANVHLGRRPDLKKILLECKEANIGVFASGPKTLRQEVASICSSGLAHNLHFESISFTW